MTTTPVPERALSTKFGLARLKQREAVILAGGLGTRLKSVVSQVPKALAPIAGKPFLHYLFQQLESQSVDRVILATGYQSLQVQNFCAERTFPFEILFSEESQPLGTGGALRKALELAKTSQVFILNGDTFFPVDFDRMNQLQKYSKLKIVMALKKVAKGDRYGSVTCENGIVRQFLEKEVDPSKASEPVLINGGILLLDRLYFLNQTARHFSNGPFSLEKDFLLPSAKSEQVGGIEFSNPFVDIGTPEDFLYAQTLIPQQVDS